MEQLGVSLVMSVFNRTDLFRLSCPTWLDGKTHPDEVLIVNDGGIADLEQAVEDLQGKHPHIPMTYQYRTKYGDNRKVGYYWSNPAIPHNWLVKEAKGPIVVIIDPEVAFMNDGLPFVYDYFQAENYDGTYKAPLADRRRSSLSAGTVYSIQMEFMHVAGGLALKDIPGNPSVSTDPTSHQIILRHGPFHGYRAWWKERYIALGGKDERYLSWGYEDLDLCHRNYRFEPVGGDACDDRIEVVEYGHGMPWMKGDTPRTRNRDLWMHESPEDGVANRGKDWGVI